jgi:Domain of unknown function (DUF4328)
MFGGDVGAERASPDRQTVAPPRHDRVIALGAPDRSDDLDRAGVAEPYPHRPAVPHRRAGVARRRGKGRQARAGAFSCSGLRAHPLGDRLARVAVPSAEECADVDAVHSSPLHPRVAVGWWFVPIANAFMPFQTVRELWKASNGERDWQGQRTWPVIGWWWALWVGAAVLNLTTPRTEGVPTLEEVLRSDQHLAVAFPLLIAAAVLAIAIVRSVGHRQERAAARPPSTLPPPGVLLPPPPPPSTEES